MSDFDDLDALVSELNSGAPGSPEGDRHLARLDRWLGQVVERSASDLLLVAGAPPSLRVNGHVTPLLEGPLGAEESTTPFCPRSPRTPGVPTARSASPTPRTA